ncbi:hypothetical protein EW146_g6089 [Bondarzewia mesenterica]|uniref:J domain-containing protein n=1 Tax=Bondarzewia mesenterica TaxID=1095465 RepID=A0A4S4LVA7_9AGAM|nr:hypothetical protein EW146_g6089 [Bondarzewia mesenterica]
MIGFLRHLVHKSASEQDIRKAYKRLSRKYHPDKNKEADAEERFVEIAHAYEVLSDSKVSAPRIGAGAQDIDYYQKRQIYDRHGEEGLKAHEGGQQYANPFDIFSNFFGGGHPGPQQARRGPTSVTEFEVSLADIYTGASIDFMIKKRVLCDHCRGTGAASDGDIHTCSGCGGSGVKVVKQQIFPGMFAQSQQSCNECGGRGRVIARPCPACGGNKVGEHTAHYTLEVPKGAPEGHEVVFEGEGDENPDWEPGDVVLRVRSRGETGGWRRKESSLYWKETIGIDEALLGFERNLTHLDGHVVPLVRKGVTQPGFVQTIKSEGMPHFEQSTYGDLFVEYIVVLPTQISTDIRRHLAEAFYVAENLTKITDSSPVKLGAFEIESDMIGALPRLLHVTFPFAYSAADAIVHLGIYAAQSSLRIDMSLPSLAARFLPFLGYKPIQPSKIQAVYFPAWIINADVRVNASLSWKNEEGEQMKKESRQHRSFMGNRIHLFLSFLLLIDGTIDRATEATRQHGSQILCLPFTFSPLSIPDALRAMPRELAIITKLQPSPPTMRVGGQFAAYPILIPLYLAEYESIQGESFTMILEAHNNRVYSTDRAAERLNDLASQIQPANGRLSSLFRALARAMGVRAEISSMGAGNSTAYSLNDIPGKVAPIEAFIGLDKSSIRDVGAWCENWLYQGSVTAGDQEEKDIYRTMQDLRVRPYEEHDDAHVKAFMKLGMNSASMKHSLEKFKQNERMGTGSQLGTTHTTMDDNMEIINLALLARWKQCAPQWWKEWQDSQARRKDEA